MSGISTIALRLREMRKAHELRLVDVAGKLGWSIQYVSDIERGNRISHEIERGIVTLNKIAELYGHEVVVELREKQP